MRLPQITGEVRPQLPHMTSRHWTSGCGASRLGMPCGADLMGRGPPAALSDVTRVSPRAGLESHRGRRGGPAGRPCLSRPTLVGLIQCFPRCRRDWCREPVTAAAGPAADRTTPTDREGSRVSEDWATGNLTATERNSETETGRPANFS